jgi:hypothetical protein
LPPGADALRSLGVSYRSLNIPQKVASIISAASSSVLVNKCPRTSSVADGLERPTRRGDPPHVAPRDEGRDVRVALSPSSIAQKATGGSSA